MSAKLQPPLPPNVNRVAAAIAHSFVLLAARKLTVDALREAGMSPSMVTVAYQTVTPARVRCLAIVAVNLVSVGAALRTAVVTVTRNWVYVILLARPYQLVSGCVQFFR